MDSELEKINSEAIGTVRRGSSARRQRPRVFHVACVSNDQRTPLRFSAPHAHAKKPMPGKKSKNRFKFFTARSLGNPTNTAVDPLGPALNIDPKVEGNHPRHELGGGRPDLTTIPGDHGPKPPRIAFRDSEQEPSIPGPSTAVAGHDFEQNDHTASECC